jgi:methionyl-tRNA synthetase
MFSRTFAMIKQHCDLDDFFVKTVDFSDSLRSFFKECHGGFEAEGVENIFNDFPLLVKEFNVQKIIRVALALSSRCNQFIEESAPWKVRKENPDLFLGIMQVLFLNIVLVAQMLYAVMPTIIGDFFDYIGLAHDLRRVPTMSVGASRDEMRIDLNVKALVGRVLALYVPSPDVVGTYSLKADPFPILFKKSLPNKESRP